MYDWCSAVESGHVTDAVYIDFKKAFDSVPHVKLKEKLLSFKYCQLTVGWITEFLAYRTQRMRVNHALSNAASVMSGIFQGSVLGPALFVLYINDLPEACRNVNVKLYADDVKVYKMITCPADRTCLQQALRLTALKIGLVTGNYSSLLTNVSFYNWATRTLTYFTSQAHQF